MRRLNVSSSYVEVSGLAIERVFGQGSINFPLAFQVVIVTFAVHNARLTRRRVSHPLWQIDPWFWFLIFIKILHRVFLFRNSNMKNATKNI